MWWEKVGEQMYEIIQVAGKLNTRLANGIYAILRCEKQKIKLRNFKNAILRSEKQTFKLRNFQRYN